MLNTRSTITNWIFAFTLASLSLFTSVSHAAITADPLKGLFGQQTEYLPVDEAFMFDFKQVDNKVVLNWTIADGYYLYKDKFQFQADNSTIAETVKQDGTQIEDEFFGVVDVYFFQSKIDVSFSEIAENGYLNIRYQGCAEAGFCYNPTVKRIPLTAISADEIAALKAASSTGNNSTNNSNNGTETSDSVSAPGLSTNGSVSIANTSQQNSLADSLANESLLWTLLIFFGLGVGLAFTPCVFPMFPILSSIIAGQSNMTVKKGLWLAFIYVQGMAITYSLLGLVVASMGVQFQAALQHPAVLITVSVIFVLLAGAMFGWYNLQLPQSWTNKLTQVSNNQKSGNLVGVFVMGLLSGLIASPCTTAPLTGALLYVAQTGDLLIGFVTLYVLSLGMGLPLLLIGASGGKLLPKAGNWMNVVKNLFGFILLAIPLILLERFVDLEWVLLLAGILLIVIAGYFHSQYLGQASNTAKSSFWVVSLFSFLLGFVLIIKPILPTPVASASAESHEVEFIKVSNMSEIKQQIAQANVAGKPVMLDLYADWCVACKEFEAFTFSDKSVQDKMADFVLLQIDMTANNDADIEVLTEYDILGLPTILFFNTSGGELTTQRVTGYMNATTFLAHLKSI
ncbi:protein-disulfide reductase DsbD [Psychrosphaera haliotis]|uniref:Thiol:disulfide interchange protein DsbD n=1 Tax=Psychrosphaera haliotis TaxID=555083 RepID=A0A6N8F8B9_9GAMM|nr:protein-disulfide reductase DsbD [Psychrosphaera haliotis]MUH72786.1 protein-disulfide reductase DsbD [Psychrosphaera haliotis]